VIRPIAPGDVEALAALYVRNREFLRAFDPDRDDAFFTVEEQRRRIATAVAGAAEGTMLRCVVLDDDGAIAGAITLDGIVRGPAQSAHLGYWIDRERNGRGLATRAVAAMLERAFGPLSLHRVEAGAIVDNQASRRVLERNGFALIGIAPRYLHVGGDWQDHALYQRLAD